MKKRMNVLAGKLAVIQANTPVMARVKTVVMAFVVLVVTGMLTACGQDAASEADMSADTSVVTDVDGESGEQSGDLAAEAGDDALPTEPLPPLEILPLENIEFSADNAFTCTYDGLSHDVILDMPETVEGASLVIMLPS